MWRIIYGCCPPLIKKDRVSYITDTFSVFYLCRLLKLGIGWQWMRVSKREGENWGTWGGRPPLTERLALALAPQVTTKLWLNHIRAKNLEWLSYANKGWLKQNSIACLAGKGPDPRDPSSRLKAHCTSARATIIHAIEIDAAWQHKIRDKKQIAGEAPRVEADTLGRPRCEPSWIEWVTMTACRKQLASSQVSRRSARHHRRTESLRSERTARISRNEDEETQAFIHSHWIRVQG